MLVKCLVGRYADHFGMEERYKWRLNSECFFEAMSQPCNIPTPRYVVCDCQHCGGHIEFDGNEFAEENSIVPCPHCGLETKIFIPILQVEKDSTELPSPVASQKAVKREGFFCGGDEPIPAPVLAEQPVIEDRSEQHSIGNTPELTEDQIKSVGKRPKTMVWPSNFIMRATKMSP